MKYVIAWDEKGNPNRHWKWADTVSGITKIAEKVLMRGHTIVQIGKAAK